MSHSRLSLLTACSCISLSVTLALAQTSTSDLAPSELVNRASSSVAMIVAAHSSTDPSPTLASALVIKENGILLTAYHAVKNAGALQVRFKNGETFDNAVLLGVDARRDIAAIKIAATHLPSLAVASPSELNPGDAVTVVSHAAALPWSVSTGVISAYRLAQDVPGAGSGYRLIQFTASVSPGSSGGVVIDKQCRAVGLVIGSMTGGQNLNFAVPIESVLGLADVAPSSAFASGADLNMPGRGATSANGLPSDKATPEAPEKSDLLKHSHDDAFILRNFKTMYIDANRAQFFGSAQLKAQLGRNNGFPALNIRIVDDARIADVVLEIGYTFPADYPFELKHQNTATVLLAGKGIGPFSGIAGAASVASEFVKAAKPYRKGSATR